MAADKAYRRDLLRALQKLPIQVSNIGHTARGHGRLTITTEDGRSKQLTFSGSPTDRDTSVLAVSRVAKQFIKGVLK